MAFRDSWHSALVYFGLAEEHHDDYEDETVPEAEIEDRYRERPNVRRLRKRRDDFDDIFADDDTGEASPVGRSRGGRSATVLKPVARTNGDVQVHLVIPKSFNDAQQIADKVFMLTPRNVEISAEERARLIEKGFFNQS